MVVDCIAYHDDAVAAAGNGFTLGSAITSALIKNDDGKIDEDSQGRLPSLKAIIGLEVDVLTTDIVERGFYMVQPNKWPNTKRIVGPIQFTSNEISESATGTIMPGIPRQRVIPEMFEIPLNKNLDLLSDNTKVGATIINADIGLLFVYSYGTRFPYMGGRLHRIIKVADGASAAADVFDEAWADQLTGVTPGLDEEKDYIIHGVLYEPGAKDKGAIFARIGAQKGEYKMIGLGPGNGVQMAETLFLWDGIPIHGTTGLIAETLSNATDTPLVGITVEEVISQAAGGFGGMAAGPIAPGIPIAAAPITGGSPGALPPGLAAGGGGPGGQLNLGGLSGILTAAKGFLGA